MQSCRRAAGPTADHYCVSETTYKPIHCQRTSTPRPGKTQPATDPNGEKLAPLWCNTLRKPASPVQLRSLADGKVLQVSLSLRYKTSHATIAVDNLPQELDPQEVEWDRSSFVERLHHNSRISWSIFIIIAPMETRTNTP